MIARRPIAVTVDRLVVHGADRATAERMALAVRAALVRQLAATPCAWHGGTRDRISLALGPGLAAPTDIGRAAGGRIGEALAAQGAGDGRGRS